MNKVIKHGLVIGRIVALYILYVVVSILAWLCLQTTTFENNIPGFWNTQLYFQVSCVYSFLIFFSLSSVFQLHHFKLKQRFYKENRSAPSILQKCGFIMRSSAFWIECATLLVCTSLFQIFPPISFLKKGFFNDLPTNRQLLSISATLLLFVLLYFVAYLSTLGWWEQNIKGNQDEKSPLSKLLIQLSYTVPIWLIGAYLLSIVYPMLTGFFKLFYLYWLAFLIISAALLLLWMSIQYGCVLICRRKLICGVHSVCKRDHRDFMISGHPYLSVFFSSLDCQITIKDSQSQYVIRFIGGTQRKNPIYLHEDGLVEYSKFYIWWSHITVEPYEFDADDTSNKILVICPCNSSVFAKNGPAERQLESGDRIFEYRIYKHFDFLKALERNGL